MTIIFFILYTVAFVLVVIYVSILLNNIQTPFCAISNIPYIILSGYNNGTVKFLGLAPFIGTLSNLSTAISNLGSVSTNV